MYNEIIIMKIKVLLSVLASLFFFSCSSNNPKSVAEDFLHYFYKGDFDNAKKYCDKQTAAMLDFVGEKVRDELKNKDESTDVEIVSVEEKGRIAYVYFTVNGGKKQEIDIKKRDGKWKVSIDKEQNKEKAMKSLDNLCDDSGNSDALDKDSVE